jgi:integrase
VSIPWAGKDRFGNLHRIGIAEISYKRGHRLSPRFHDLRHGAASLLMVLTNGDRGLVADILGVSVTILDRIYAHTDSFSPRHREALERLGALFTS